MRETTLAREEAEKTSNSIYLNLFICILLREYVRISLEECVLRVHPLYYAEYVEPEECGDADEGDSATRGHEGKVDRLFK